jgi:FKBP-type peptidyl-prolyl cis-trans isomerase SlyD
MNALKPFALVICAALAHPAFAAEEDPMIAAGSTVQLEFTLFLDDGSIVFSNVGKEPVRYVHGDGSLFAALESAFAGHVADDQIEVQLSPVEAYGAVNPELLQSVPINDIPEEARKEGVELRAEGFDGPIRVTEVQEDTVILDFNHPLAGEDLKFDVRILSVEPGDLE